MIRYKKIISIAMSMVVMATAFSTNVFACHDNDCCPIPNIIVNINNAGEINLPNNYPGEGEPIIRGGNADNVITVNIDSRVSKLVGTFMDFTNLQNVNIPPDSRLREIGANAFSGCRQLTNISIPNGVTSIGRDAFRDCINLQEITIPDSVTRIDRDAFLNCDSLETVNIGRRTVDSFSDVFKNLNVETVNITSGIRKIKEETFMDCQSLVTVNIPITVRAIGKRAFIGCINLRNVNINPNINEGVGINPAILEVGEMAFTACQNLQNVSIPENITRINRYAFLGCTSLVEVTIPDNVERICGYAFLGCINLERIFVPRANIFDDFALAGDERVNIFPRNNVVQ